MMETGNYFETSLFSSRLTLLMAREDFCSLVPMDNSDLTNAVCSLLRASFLFGPLYKILFSDKWHALD
jgi:hypothetical protein